jgi:hypothetical protein
LVFRACLRFYEAVFTGLMIDIPKSNIIDRTEQELDDAEFLPVIVTG